MEAFFAQYGPELLFAIISASVLGYCRSLVKRYKEVKQVLLEKEKQELDKAIEEKININVEPILDELEELRKYTYRVGETEEHHRKLLVSSYRYRLV